MDRRILFTLVFFTTLFSTFCVFLTSLFTNQTWMNTLLYSLITMWVVGIVSQIAIKHLYLSLVKPMEVAKAEQELIREIPLDLNIEEVEAIDEITQKSKNRKKVSAEPISEQSPV